MKNSFYEKKEYSLSDLEELIKGEIEESSRLEYKAAGSLGKGESEKKEISKDISAFANSDGGIIVYGINEENHKPKGYSFVDGNTYTKEWLENIIDGNIKKIVPGIEIHPIRVDGQIEKSIYIVKIPMSYDAPHMNSDKKFYRRYNFKSVAMEEYEVRLLYFRKSYSELKTTTIAIDNEESFIDDNGIEKIRKEILINVKNVGESLEKHFKLQVSFKGIPSDKSNAISVSYEKNSNVSHTSIKDKGIVISAHNTSPIFPKEEILLCKFDLNISSSDYEQFEENAVIRFKLFSSHDTHYSSIEFSKLVHED